MRQSERLPQTAKWIYTPLLLLQEGVFFSAMPTLYRTIFQVISPIFRRKRLAQFEAYVRPTPRDTMLDIGGTARMWEGETLPLEQVHVLNLDAFWVQTGPSALTSIVPMVGNALALPVADDAFDIVFSNSVIEHVGTWENQLQFAAEARRAGKRLWIQTPAREFFMEPHYITPFVHWLPKSVQRKVLRHFSVWGWLTRPSQEIVAETVDEIRLLTHAEMKVLFPDCEILRERVGGMTKSYIAYRP